MKYFNLRVAIAVVVVLLGAGGFTLAKVLHKNPTPVPVVSDQTTTLQPVKAWVNKYGSFINTLLNDGTAISKASGADDVPALLTACQNESNDVGTIKTYPVIPDAEAASHMSAMLVYFSAGTASCIEGANNVIQGEATYDASQVNQGASQINDVVSDLQKATQEVQKLNDRLNALANS